ncbi:FAD-dependent oxidoreductase [Kribbella jejuensis]|uniref:Glycine/D-amino acid oxidase-like deaminating enzyme n=1 Tax=Kribbella jejuensis TaxID=236068 RepID=A0A542EA38_9ACTN|nr:FAD-dependent oxidoreductase [Kribbella jejuensis]TQJ12197.1 glycine/D-amino acid oxidase-like deaminating enzyme [Kribbella jejuensis]
MSTGSVWLATSEQQQYPALGQDLVADVVVVGGGVVGLTTALLAQRDGARVVVLEADRVGSGTTGYTTGKVTSQHSLSYAELVARQGEEKARLYAEANQAAVERVAELAEQVGIDCDLTRAPAYVYTLDAGQRDKLEEEAAAAVKLGLPAELTTELDLPFAVEAAVRFERQLHFHPARYLAGLAAAFTAAGGSIYEQTRVLDIEEQRDRTVQLTAGTATVQANQIVVATLLPPGTLGGYFAKTRPTRSYGLACRLRGDAPRSMAISIDTPTRSTRPWLTPGPGGLIVVGNDHETGAADVDTQQQYRELEDWTRVTFDVESVDHRWSSQDYTTPDRIPYVGRAPLHHMVWVATGFQKWGLSNGTAAAMVLTDLLADRDNAWLPVFDATRIGDAQAVAKLIKDNLKVGKEFVGGRFDHPVEQLAPGTGGIVEYDGHRVGAYRDQDGTLYAVEPTCTHLGCPLHWNSAETSWDCNCHGSRFAVDGAILDGPAGEPLEQLDTP